MGYTRNFGFRSFENIVRPARHQTPAHEDGVTWIIGTGAVRNGDGFVRKPEADEPPTPMAGVLVYEHIQYQGMDPLLADPVDQATIPNMRYVQVVHGNGTKVWFKNTDDAELYDLRVRPGLEMVADLENIEAGDYLKPTEDGFWEAGDATTGWFQIEQLDAESGLVECRFTF